MPLERISKGFKDLSMSFQISPLNNDLIALKNETAIARSVRNLVLTIPGERLFNPELGSDINQSLFENIDGITASQIKSQIETTLAIYEPRVDLVKVIVNPDYDNNGFYVTINYRIIGIDSIPQQLSFALQPTR